MNYLADTHVFLWWMADSAQLSPAVHDLVRTRSLEIAFSAVSCWEISIKAGLGKIRGLNPELLLPELAELGWAELPLHYRHIPKMHDLEDHHRDPFDRALIAQAITDNLTLITRDAKIARYPVPTFW